MTPQILSSHSKLDRTMSSEQFNQVVEAILAGKYSWACVLILRFAGYNPLHYIPYRTYNRLLKENCQLGSSNRQTTARIKTDDQKSESNCAETPIQHCSTKLKNLSYLESVDNQRTQIHGGKLDEWLDTAKFDLAEYNRQDFSVLSW